MTRDSVALMWAQILSALVTVAGLIVDPRLGLLDAAYLGLSETVTHRIVAAAVIVLYLSGKLSRSPLPGAKNEPASGGTSVSGWLVPLVLVTLMGLSLAACASLPVKQQAVASLAASETALEGAHNMERILCSPTADQAKPIRHCDGVQAAQLGLTDDVHRKLAGIFAQAFDAHERAAAVLKVWKANDPPPATVGDYLRIASQALSLARQQVPQATDLLTKLQLAVDNASIVASMVGQGGK